MSTPHPTAAAAATDIATPLPFPAPILLPTSSFKFRFDHIFHNASQAAVYDLYARDTVLGVVDGINGAIMSYGQTGSGKTFTMLGDISNYEHRGTAPRSIGQIFQEVRTRTTKYTTYAYHSACMWLYILTLTKH
jgi:hypothetical protein